MKFLCMAVTTIAATLILSTTGPVHAQNTADASLELTFTLSGITKTDTLTNTSSNAILETSMVIGDLMFEDFGPNGSVISGGGTSNPAGSIGTASSTETTIVNGIDPFGDDEINADTFGIGDSWVSTMTADASATTPGSVFFGQANSDNTLFFSSFSDDTDQFTFHFDFSAELDGTLNTTLPGVSLVSAQGLEVEALADSTTSGIPNEFVATSDFFSFVEVNSTGGIDLVDEMNTGSFDVIFDPGDSDFQITFTSNMVVNGRVSAVPEPTSLWLVALVLAPIAIGRRRMSH